VSYLKTDRNLPFEMLIKKNKGILNLSGEWEFDLNKHFDSRILEKSHIKINDSFSSTLF